MRYLFRLLAAVLLAVSFRTALASENIRGMEDLSGKRVATLTGSIFRSRAEPLVSGVRYLNYNDNSSEIQALLADRVDAVLIDEPVARMAVAAFPDRLRIACVYAKNANGFAFRKGSPLTEKASGVIRRLQQSGELKRMTEKWCDSADAALRTPAALPKQPAFTGKNGELHFIADPVMEPMCYSGPNGEFIGLDIDLARRIAHELDMTFRFTPMDFRGEIEALTAGRADMAGGSMFITEERLEKVDFTVPYYEGGLAVLARRGAMTSENLVTIGDVSGLRVAYLNGSVFKTLTEPFVKNVTYLAYNDNTSSVQALRNRKVEALLIDEPVARNIVARFPSELRIACVYAKDSYGFAFRKNGPLRAKADAVLRRLRQSGELQRLSEKWCDSRTLSELRPEKLTHRADFTGKNGELHFVSDPTLPPMCYAGPDGTFLGLEIELIRRIAYELDMTFRFTPMDFRGEIEALMAGKADVAGGTMSITEERKEKVDFTEPYYIGGLTLVARRAAGGVAAEAVTELSQLYGKRIGTVGGTTLDAVLRKEFPSSVPVAFPSLDDLPEALAAGRIEAFLAEEPVAKRILAAHPEIVRLPKRLPGGDYAMIFPPSERSLCDAFSRELRKLREDGTAAALQRAWEDGHPASAVGPKQPKGTLRYAVVPETAPNAFLHRGSVVGSEIDLVTLAAARLGYALEPVPTDWTAYTQLVASGSVRFGVGCTTVTDDRKRTLIFSEPTGSSRLSVLVRRAPPAAAEVGFGTQLREAGLRLRDSFVRTFVRENRWKLLVRGLSATVVITLCAAALGTLLAFGICMLRRSRSRLLSGMAKGYIAVMQGTPILVILMILYYLVFAKVNLDAMAVAVIGFALNFAAYVGEMIRSGIEGIPKGQYEAAHALGFTRFAAFRKVILPQVLRRILPIYRGEFVSMLKMTSVVGYIAIEDLTKMSDIIRSRTYEAFFPLLVTALIYFAAAHLLALVITRTEQRLDPNVRRRKALKKQRRAAP